MRKIISFILVLSSSLVLVSQNITGIVKDSGGLPIANALVMKVSTPSVWVKTNSTGSFTITGNSGDKLKVAAYRYQTISNYPVSSTSNVTITLATDPVLATDACHISFDHLRPGVSYTEKELKVDFPVANGIGFADVDPKDDRASVDITESIDPNGTSLKVKFPKDVLKTSSSGIDVRIPIQGTYKVNTFKSDDLYLSYWVKFSDNFDFSKCGGKLPSLGGDYTLDNNRWKGRIMWRNGGSVQFYPELFGKEDTFESDFDRFWGDQLENNGSICSNKLSPYLTNGTWHNIELHYKFETPGQSDGYFEGWIDGEKAHKVTNSNKFGFWRPVNTNDDITINYILLSTFLGGSDLNDYAHKEDVYAWFDEFRVSTTRVNEYSKYNNPVAVNQSSTIDLNAVYPNPSEDGIFHLVNSSTWEMIDLQGKSLLKGQGIDINLSNYPKGMYLLNIEGSLQKLMIK